MGAKLRNGLALAPPAAMIPGAAWILLRAREGGFNSMMGFPLVFAGVLTGFTVLALFVGRRELRRATSVLLAIATLLAWGAAWSHHAFFERQREMLDREGRAAFAGRRLEPIPYLWALNVAEESPFVLDGPHDLLNVWATWCGPCVEEMPMLEAFWQRHRAAGARIVGVTRLTSADEAAELVSIGKFLEDHDISYPVLVVAEPVYDRFEVRRLPTSLRLEHGEVKDYRVTVDGTETLLAAIEAGLASR